MFGNESRLLKDPPTIEEYKKWLQSIGVKSQSEFRKIPKTKFPNGYPKDPNNHYGKQGTWKGWSELTGTRSHFIKNPPTYEEYKKWLQSIGVKSQSEFRKIPKTKFPNGYPKDPHYYYQETRNMEKLWGLVRYRKPIPSRVIKTISFISRCKKRSEGLG